MKTSEFINKYNLSRDTVRYYISKGLLLPEHTGTRINFTDKDCKDLEFIRFLQKMHFSLKDIQRFLTMARQSNMIEPDILQEERTLFIQQKDSLQQEIQDIQEAISLIDHELERIQTLGQTSMHKLGVPLSALSYLCCPVCGKRLLVKDASIDDDSILQGSLSCSCGNYHAQIRDGIICTENRYTGTSDSPDLNRNSYRTLDNAVFFHIQKCLNMVLSQLISADLSGKVVMESHINGYFFLYHHFHELPSDVLYIITDRFPEMLEMYKKMIELLGLDLQILFIADDSMDYPLRPECVDYHINFLCDNEHMLYHQNTYILDCSRYDAEHACVTGCYWAYPPTSQSLKMLRKKYPDASAQIHSVDHFKADCRQAGYTVTMKKLGKVIPPKSENYIFSCQQGQDPLEIYFFNAVR